MFTGLKLIAASLVMIMPACSTQVTGVSIGPLTTVTPFALPPTWTPSPTLPPKITPTPSPTDTVTPRPRLIPTSALRNGWFLLTELSPTESIGLETARSFVGMKIPPLPDGVTEEFVNLYPSGGELPSGTITYQVFVMRFGNARMLWIGVPFAESDPWREGQIYDAIPLPTTQAGDILIAFTCSRSSSNLSESLLIVIATRPKEEEPATEIHYAWRIDPLTTTLESVNYSDIECWSY